MQKPRGDANPEANLRVARRPSAWDVAGNPAPTVVFCSDDPSPIDTDPVELFAFLQIEPAGGLSQALSSSPLLALGAMFGAGLLTSLTPCVYPMIPITAAVIAGTSREGQPKSRTVGLTLTYAVGLATLYAVLGALAGISGQLFGTVSASPWARLAIGNMLILFALAMLDVLPIPVPRKLMAYASRTEGGSYGSVFVMGAMSGVVAAPCGAPAFAVVLTWVAATQAGLMGFVYLFVFSLGMTALLVGVGLFSGTLTLLPRSGVWMVWVKRIAAVIMIGMAEYYFVTAGYNL
ncbi:MAG: sulfite exporter TauE/SafE family protein [Thioalkalivibrio sp.]|nr:sulfite exporter TauE/SafE family protein [Thioalkalivibrio sp.]